MLENRIKAYIERFLGEYVECDKLELSLYLWESENLRLLNVNLKSSILPYSFPFRFKVARIGEIKANIPFTSLGKLPIKLILSDVLIIFAPRLKDELDRKEEELTLDNNKKELLMKDLMERLEGHIETNLDSSIQDNNSNNTTTTTNNNNNNNNSNNIDNNINYSIKDKIYNITEGYFGIDGFIGRIITRIIDNLQFDIKTMHIRFEGINPNMNIVHENVSNDDPESNSYNMDSNNNKSNNIENKTNKQKNENTKSSSQATRYQQGRFAIGASLESFSAWTTDETWTTNGWIHTNNIQNNENNNNKKFFNNIVFKMIQFINLSFYINPNTFHLIHSSVHPKVIQSTLARLQKMIQKKYTDNPWWDKENSQVASQKSKNECVEESNMKVDYEHHFIVSPVGGTIKLTMNTAAVHSETSEPRYRAILNLSTLICAIDEEQISLIYKLLEGMDDYYNWCKKIAFEKNKKEAQCIVTKEIKTKYLNNWKIIINLINDADKGISVSNLSPETNIRWKEILEIEKKHSIKDIIVMRNQADFEQVYNNNNDTNGKTLPIVGFRYPDDLKRSVLDDIGEIFNISSPEIHIKFHHGKIGLKLHVNKNNEIAVLRCYNGSQAEQNKIKTGLVVAKINGKNINLINTKQKLNPTDVAMLLDTMRPPRIVTFRYPSKTTNEYTIQNKVVSQLEILCGHSQVDIVLAHQKKLLISNIFDDIHVHFVGHGPGLFYYDFYKIESRDLYVVNCCSDKAWKSCILSTRTQDNLDSFSNVSVSIDYLCRDHPAITKENGNLVYATKYNIKVKGVVFVFEKYKLMDLIENFNILLSIIYQPSALASTISINEEKPTNVGIDVSLNHFSVYLATCNNEDDYKNNENIDSGKIYQYNKLYSLTANNISSDNHSYHNILSQVTAKGHQVDMNAMQKMWSVETDIYRKIIQSIINLQKRFRGIMARKNNRIILSRIKSSTLSKKKDNMMHGWLYVQDNELSFRRWNRFFFFLCDNGYLYYYADGSTKYIVNHLYLKNVTTIIYEPNITMPVNTVNVKNIVPDQLIFSISESKGHGDRSLVLAGETVDITNKWINKLNLMKKKFVEDIISKENKKKHQELCLRKEKYSLEQNSFMLNFTNIFLPKKKFKKCNSCFKMNPIYQTKNWLRLNLKRFQCQYHFHYSNKNSNNTSCGNNNVLHNAGTLKFSASSLSLWDYRRSEFDHGILRIGNTFLDLNNGKLKSVLVATPFSIPNSAVLKDDINEKYNDNNHNLVFTFSYKGANAQPNIFTGTDTGLLIDMKVSFWTLPINFTIALKDIMDQISFLIWPEQNSTNINLSSSLPADVNSSDILYTNKYMYNVPNVRISFVIRMMEFYIEEKNCAAKLGFENNHLDYSADTAEERIDLLIGPTALFLLIKDVSIRLVKIEKLLVEYMLKIYNNDPETRRLQRSVTVNFGSIKLEADRRMRLLLVLMDMFTSPLYNDTIIKQEDEFSETEQQTELKENNLKPSPKKEKNKKSKNNLETDLSTFKEIENLRTSVYSVFSLSLEDDINNSSLKKVKESQQNNAGHTLDVFLLPFLCYQNIIMIEPNNINNIVSNRSSSFFSNMNNDKDKVYNDFDSLFYLWGLHHGSITDEIILSFEEVIFEIIKSSLHIVSPDIYIPVIKISLNKLQCRSLSKSEYSLDFRIFVGIEITARYYNTTLADWEPFIEPWHIHSNILKTSEDSEIVIQLKAIDRLNINITEALIKLFTSIRKSRKYLYNEINKKNINIVDPTKDNDDEELKQAAAFFHQNEKKKLNTFANSIINGNDGMMGRVCVLNNLGVPIRLANLNTSNPGDLIVEIRDGWSLPDYIRYHDSKIDITLLPWWEPREIKSLKNMRHKFILPFSGAQPGVAPKIRVKFFSKYNNNMFLMNNMLTMTDNDTNRNDYEANDIVNNNRSSRIETISPPNIEANNISYSIADNRVTRKHDHWLLVGTTEIDLVGKLAATEHPFKQWYRLKNREGIATGELIIAIQFFPTNTPISTNTRSGIRSGQIVPASVKTGDYLLFDPLHVNSRPRNHSEIDSNNTNIPIVLSNSLRGTYIPPLALEIEMDGMSHPTTSDFDHKTINLLCPLKRSGKFLIKGDDGILVEVKVAQRDEWRRVLLLAGPVQFKNFSSLDINLWSIPATMDMMNMNNNLNNISEKKKRCLIKPRGRLSVPLNALYGKKKKILMIQVQNSKPTIVTAKESLETGGTHLLYLEPQDSQPWGYCFYVDVKAQVRNVYQEQQQDIKSTTSNNYSVDYLINTYDNVQDLLNDNISNNLINHKEDFTKNQATKYEIKVSACVAFENTLPVRLQYEIRTMDLVASDINSSQNNERKNKILIRAGTLAPGEEIQLYEYSPDAIIYLRLPNMDTSWVDTIYLSDCILKNSHKNPNKYLNKSRISIPDPPEVRRDADVPIYFYSNHISSLGTSIYSDNTNNNSNHLFTARLDYTVSDNGAPRVVLYASLWIYNESHVEKLLFREVTNENNHESNEIRKNLVTCAPKMISDNKIPCLMDCPSQLFEIGTVFDQEVVSYWSEKTRASIVGVLGRISLISGNVAHVFHRKDIGLAIHRPSGVFHRSAQVIITSRYVFVNHTNIDFEVQEVSMSSSLSKNITHSVLSYNSHHSNHSQGIQNESFSTDLNDDKDKRFTPFDYSAYTCQNIRIRPKVKSFKWTGQFSIEEEKEFPLRLRGNLNNLWDKTQSNNKLDNQEDFISVRYDRDYIQRVRIRIQSIGATIVIKILMDTPPMFCIRNHSSFDFQFCQINYGRKKDRDILLTGQEIPYAWDLPDGIRTEKSLKVNTMRRFDFEQLDREKGSIILWLHGNRSKTISSEIVVEGRSRILVFNDDRSKKINKYILEVTIISMRRFQLNKNIPLSSNLVSHIDLIAGGKELKTGESKLSPHHIYRYDNDSIFYLDTRPRELFLYFYEYEKSEISGNNFLPINRHSMAETFNGLSSIIINRKLSIKNQSQDDNNTTSNILPTPKTTYQNLEIVSNVNNYEGKTNIDIKNLSKFRQVEANSNLNPSMSLNVNEQNNYKIPNEGNNHLDDHEDDDENDIKLTHPSNIHSSGTLHIKFPRKAWDQSAKGTYRNLNTTQGYWWDIFSITGEPLGKLQVALKFRKSRRIREISTMNNTNVDMENNISTKEGNNMWIRLIVPSIGFSFVHNTNMIEVAYLSFQRVHLLWSQKNENNEIAIAIGNIQMDNQMESKVVLGPSITKRKEGVSIRLRDRWKNCLQYGKHKGIFEQIDYSTIDVLQFRILWNNNSIKNSNTNDTNEGDEITHVELIELLIQELEIATDEKFVVHLISVFQGLEIFLLNNNNNNQVESYNEIVDQSINYFNILISPESLSIYIEQLDLESIRIKFSLDLNGGRYIATLGPSGRRLAGYLPESNVKNFKLYFSKLMLSHVYGQQVNIIDQLYRHYQQQAVVMILRGIYTVAVFVNPFRIAYRLGHGFLEVIRLPARGLASGSPVEFITGAYLGIRSLAINTISASYETIAGVSGIMASIVSFILPENKKKSFRDDMIGFQRTILNEVDALDASEERHMTKTIIRQPRIFSPNTIGLLTEYGPGSVPFQVQQIVDIRAAVLIQCWWRRRRLMEALYKEIKKLQPTMDKEKNKNKMKCTIM